MPGQWFGDALTIGTLMVFLAIGVTAVFGEIPQLDWISDVPKANMLLVALAFVYAGGVLVKLLWDSVKKDEDADEDE